MDSYLLIVHLTTLGVEKLCVTAPTKTGFVGHEILLRIRRHLTEKHSYETRLEGPFETMKS